MIISNTGIPCTLLVNNFVYWSICILHFVYNLEYLSFGKAFCLLVYLYIILLVHLSIGKAFCRLCSNRTFHIDDVKDIIFTKHRRTIIKNTQ